jgi:endonuclease III
MTINEAEEFLTSLPGVGLKVAKCVLMYSLKRDVLPVDVHVHRVATRLGFRSKKRPDTSQALIEGAVPPHLRYSFHVNAIAHGRTVCLPRNPRCGICPLSAWCDYYQKVKESHERTA